MASKEDSRRKFARALVKFMDEYAFDGADIDWEYPGAEDRGGVPEDTENYVKLMKDIRLEFDNAGGGYGLTFTIPASFWYLRWFDVAGMLDAGADWANIMSYDMHGTWDSDENFVGKVLGAHTDSVEIQGALNLLWREPKIDPKKIIMGFGFYGRSFKMANPSCNVPGCRHADGGSAGSCTDTSGVLSWDGE
ncbi:Endochitinase [Dactylellina cionopaga]|nr:Endochitinase [Dactylellina cionopaga]